MVFGRYIYKLRSFQSEACPEKVGDQKMMLAQELAANEDVVTSYQIGKLEINSEQLLARTKPQWQNALSFYMLWLELLFWHCALFFVLPIYSNNKYSG